MITDVTLCRDCRYAHITYHGEVKYCDVWSPDETVYMDADKNFCSQAEPKDAQEEIG